MPLHDNALGSLSKRLHGKSGIFEPEMDPAVHGDAVLGRLRDGCILKMPTPRQSLFRTPKCLEEVVQVPESLLFACREGENVRCLWVRCARKHTSVPISVHDLASVSRYRGEGGKRE